MRKVWSMIAAAVFASAGMALATPAGLTFANIDGGSLALDDWAGQPVLVVNTASMCAFTPQYEELQSLYDTYRDQGLVVLAVPSDDFRQELDSAAEVKEFCELTYGIDMPMTEITHVTGTAAHPLYQWIRQEVGFVPRWNFNKVLLDGAGDVVATWGSATRPMSKDVRRAVEAALAVR